MIKVKFFPLQAHSLAFGGFEVQMLTLFENIKRHAADKVEVEKIDVWSRDSDYDIAHFWGLEAANYNNILWAKNSGKKVVITVLLSYYESVLNWGYDKVSKYIGYKKFQLEMLKLVDAVVVLNDLQKSIGEKKFNIPSENLFIIPNIIHDNFLKEKEAGDYKLGDYVLCVGNICERKNQVNLAKACDKNKVKVILVGKVLPGEEGYADQLDNICESSNFITWIKGLPENSPELIDLVKNCRVFALLSKQETQPISILEAATFDKQVVLSDRKFAYQSYFRDCQRVNADDINNIVKGIKEVFASPDLYKVDARFLAEFDGENVVSKYIEVYNNVLNKM